MEIIMPNISYSYPPIPALYSYRDGGRNNLLYKLDPRKRVNSVHIKLYLKWHYGTICHLIS